MRLRPLHIFIFYIGVFFLGLNANANLEIENSTTPQSMVAFEGLIPAAYVHGDHTSYAHVVMVVDQETRLIKKIETNKENFKAIQNNPSISYLQLKRGENWDVMYPGLIDLHNHTKYNNIGVLENAKGQFANRFEWRPWGPYKKAVGGNINPWSGYGKIASCAYFRWSELQAMTLGTTYLQGPSSCVENFGIQRVERSDSYVSNKANIQAPTDIVVPADMVFVWNTLGPIIRKIQKNSIEGSMEHRLAYETSVAQVVNQFCPGFKEKGIAITRDSVRGEAIQYLKDKVLLTEVCQKENLPRKFLRYIYWVHKSIIGKKLYAESISRGNGSAIIAHLGEGRRDDLYNQKEFEVIKLLGLDLPHVNFVHGVGITDQGLREMGEKQMGLIWSPYSNLLLYNQTLDIVSASKNNVLIALGSDWLPTGSRGILEEVKLARNYIKKMNFSGEIVKSTGSLSLDEALFKMMTENPAKMINHWQGVNREVWSNGEATGGVGTLAEGAMGTFIVTSKVNSDPYTNLVKDITAEKINLVVVDGKVQYGNQSYLQQVNLEFEPMPNGEHEMEKLKNDIVPFYVDAPTKEQKFDLMVALGQYVNIEGGRARGVSHCLFDELKGFVHQDSLSSEKELLRFKDESGLNMDRYSDLQKFLGIHLMTQSRNRNDSERGDPAYTIKDFAPLFSCNDKPYWSRLTNFVKFDDLDDKDEWTQNSMDRAKRIEDGGLGRIPKKLSDHYPSHSHSH